MHQIKSSLYALYLHIDKVKSAQRLWHAGDDGPVSRGVIVQLKQRRGNELVVTRHCEVRFLLQLYKEQLSVLLRFSDVRRYIRVLSRFKIWSPPVPNSILYNPV